MDAFTNNDTISWIPKIPNEVTIQTFSDTDKDINVIICKDEGDLFEKLEI